MSEIARTTGLVGNAGMKVPVRAASTAVLTLSGEQTIDGVACVTDDRVLVKDQASSIDNGIYVVDTGSWERSKDADGSYDFRNGSLVYVNEGTVNGDKVFRCSGTDPIDVDTDAMTFTALDFEVTGFPDSRWCGTATGTANALVLTPAAAVTALTGGLELTFKSSAAGNSAATTIAVSGLAATAAQSNGAAMAGGEIEASKWYRATYDGAALQVERVAPAVLLDMFTAGGQIPVATGDGKVAAVAALNKAIYGLTYGNNAADATNDLDIAAGGAMDATGAYWLTVAALTKQSDVVWAVGTGAGALDAGAAGNSDYYIWAIARSDTGVTDALFSLSSTAPTMPANYDFKRLIGWFKRVGGTIVAFTTYETEGGGIEHKWNAPTLDVNLAATLTTSRRTDAVKVPLNFSTIALLRVHVADNTAAFAAIISCPDETDAAAAAATAPGVSIISPAVSASGYAMEMAIRTSAAGLIAARAGIATVDQYDVATLGFRWARRN